MITSVLFFSSKTEQARIVAIHRPIMIIQERKTPAYYVYQQAQLLQQKKTAAQNRPTTYLSRLSLSVPEIKIQISEMKFDKKQFLASPSDTGFRTASFSNKPKQGTQKLTYEQVFSVSRSESSPNQQIDPAEQALRLPASKRWATIKGKFELIDGVGIVDHHIELKRIEEGQVREIGYIDLKAGAYSIDIESPQGYLIAQIKDRNGSLIGEDRERLINLQSRGTFFEGPFIRVGQPEGVAVNPVYAGNGKTATIANNKALTTPVASVATRGPIVSLFDNQKTLESYDDVFANVSNYSSTISRVFDPSRIYKNITTIRHTGEKTETAMFTTKWVEGVVAYISDMQKIEFKSKNGPLIIGRVLLDGKPTSEAQIQIDTAPGMTPIYFDKFMIPAFTQNATSENGYFMFIGVEPGNYHIVATKQNKVLGSQMFVAEEESVAFQNISSQLIPQNKIIRIFDAFTSSPIAADVVLDEAEEAIEAPTGTTVYKTFAESSTKEFLVRTNNRDYVPLRYTQNSHRDYVHIPMIQESWLAAVKTFKKIEYKPNTGIIIGFTSDLVYDAYLVSEEYDKNDIVYFDSIGQVVSAPVKGGGFIFYNVPVGARELVLQEKNNERIYSQVFNILAQQISSAHFLAD